MKKVVNNYEGHMTRDEILDNAVNVDDKLDNFGLRREHKGEITLRQFLTDNGIKLD